MADESTNSRAETPPQKSVISEALAASRQAKASQIPHLLFAEDPASSPTHQQEVKPPSPAPGRSKVFVDTSAPFRGQVPINTPSPAAEPERAAAPSGSVGTGLIRCFTLMVKMIPVLLVLAGGFYFYDSMFGKMTPEEMAAQGLRPVSADGKGGQSRASLMINQTKAVVAAQSAHVEFANSLADMDGAMEDPPLSSQPLASGPGLPALGLAAEKPPVAAPAAHVPSPPPPPVAVTVYSSSNISTELVHSTLPVSSGFLAWAETVQVSGVRISDTRPRALINGVLHRGGDVVDHKLNIVFDHVDTETKAVVFREKSGATLSKPF